MPAPKPTSFRLSDTALTALDQRAGELALSRTSALEQLLLGQKDSTKPHVNPVDTTMAVDPIKEDMILDTSSDLWQLWTTPFAQWNPDLMRFAKRQADNGDLTLVSDLWEGMLGDDRVSGAVEQRILASESLPLSFAGPSRAAKRLQEWWTNVVTPGTRAQILRWGLGVGICPVYIRTWHDGVPEEIEVWHPRWLRYYQNERRWKLVTRTGIVDVDSCPGRLYLFTPFCTPYERPWIPGLWYSTCTPWLGKSFAYPDLANFGQQHASPKWFLNVIDGNATISKAQKLEAIQWLSRVPSRATMFVPYPFKVEQQETNSTAWQAFTEQIDMANAALARRILGHDASMDKDATHASALAALDVKMSLVRFDVDAEGSFWKLGLLKTWSALNGLSTTPYPVRDTTPPDDLQKAASVQNQAAGAFKTLIDAGVSDIVDVRKFLGRYFPLKDEDGTVDEEAPTSGIQMRLELAERQRRAQDSGNQYRDRLVRELEGAVPLEQADKAQHLVEESQTHTLAQRALEQGLEEIESSSQPDMMAQALLLAQAEGMRTVGRGGVG